MKRVFRKAIAFLSAVAVAATMAVSASAVSAATRIVKDGEYKQVIVMASETGIFFTNFSKSEIESKTSDKTVLCVTPDGKKKKVKIKNSADVSWCSSATSRSVFTYGSAWMELHYSDNSRTGYIFTTGKSLILSGSQGIAYNADGYNGYIYSRNTAASAFKVYNDKGEKSATIPYSSLKGADADLIEEYELGSYDSDSKAALFCGYDSKTDKQKYWLVVNNKTVRTFSVDSADLIRDKNGSCAVHTCAYDAKGNMKEAYYSVSTGKVISDFEGGDYSGLSRYSIRQNGSKYSIRKDGREIYSIEKKNAAGYYAYADSVAIVTKSGSKYGLIMVK